MAVERENKPLLGTANVLKQTKNHEKLVRDYGEPAANGLLAKAINNAVSIALAVAIFTTGLPALAATQEECKPQAATAKDMLEMIDSRDIPATAERRAAVQKAVDLYQAGDYCAARQIIMNLEAFSQK